MTYIDGYAFAVETKKKQIFIDYAKAMDALFLEYGAVRVMECWGDDVPDGETTDFKKAVNAQADEAVLFSWVEWPDKETRDAGLAKMMNDPRMDPKENPMPFDGKRMIYGGFAPVVELT